MFIQKIKSWMQGLWQRWVGVFIKKQVPQLPKPVNEKDPLEGVKKEEIAPGVFLLPEGEKKVHWKCGHESWASFVILLYGEKLKPRKEVLEAREVCGVCAVKEILPYMIRCCNCGKSIVPGDPVGLYCGRDAIAVNAADNTGIGCMRWECGTGAAFAGHWTGSEVKPAFPDGMSAIEMAAKSGKAICVNDMHNADSKPEEIDISSPLRTKDKKDLN